MSVSKLSERIMQDFLDLDRLSEEECLKYEEGRRSRQRLTQEQCMALSEALGPGLEAEITPSERAALRRLGVSDSLINEIGGKDGKEALRRRAMWLGQYYLSPDPLRPSSVLERVRAEIFDMGPHASGALAALVKMLGEGDMRVAAGAADILGKIGPAAKNAVPALSKLVMETRAITAEAERGGEFDQAAWNAGVAGISAVRALGRIGDPSGLRALVAALHFEYKGIRPHAARAIGNIGKGRKIDGHIKGALRDLILVSQDSDPKLREAVGEAFAMMNIKRDLIARWLIAILGDEQESMEHRRYAARALGRMGRDAAPAAAALSAVVRSHPDIMFKQDAAFALMQIGTKESLLALKAAGTEESIAAIVEGLYSKEVGIRRACAALLAHIGDASSVEVLIEKLSDTEEDERVRRRVADALGAVADAAAVPALIEALTDDSSAVAAASARALGRTGSDKIGRHARRAVAPLVALYSRSDPDAREFAAYALGVIGPQAKAALNPLSEGLTHSEKGVYEMTFVAMMRIDAARAVREIRELGPDSAYLVPIITRSLSVDSGTIKRACAILLAQYGAEAASAVPALIREMRSDSAGKVKLLREQIINTLGSIGPAAGAAVAPIIEAFEKGSERERAAAIDALAKIDGLSMSTIPYILSALNDKSRSVRDAASAALGRMDDSAVVASLIDCIRDGEIEAAKVSALHLAGMKDSAGQTAHELGSILAYSDVDRRILAAYVLGNLGAASAQSVTGLLVAANDENDALKAAARTALNRMPHSMLLDALARIAADEHAQLDVRLTAVNGLGSMAMHYGEAASSIVGTLTSKNAEVRKHSFKVLHDLGNKTVPALPALAALLSSDDLFVKRGVVFLIKSIGGINDEAGSIVPALLLARQDEDSLMKRFADEALLSIERKALLSALIDCLESDNDSIRLGATFYLFKVGKVDVKAVPALLKGLSHQDQRMKRGSESVLSSINEKELVPALIRALRSDDVLVRRGAAFYFWKATPRTDSKRIVKALNQAANDSDRILQIAVEKALERYR